jgi:hypothetical protein
MQSGAHGYYDTLGIPRTASSDDIRKAHRELARRYHPDLNPGDKFAEARFRDVQEAYDILIDPATRRIHDLTTFHSEPGLSGAFGGTTNGASPRPAANHDSSDGSEWMQGGAAGDAGLRDFYVPPREDKTRGTSEGLLWFMLVSGWIGAKLLPDVSRSQAMASLGWAGYRVYEPVAMLFAMGFLLGGTRGNFTLRYLLLNAAAWCCLICYSWTAHLLEWPAIVQMLPWFLPTHAPIIMGMWLRRGGIN